MAAIAVSDLSYAHPGGDLLFSGVSFRVTDGRHAGLVGANGAGKTTLMRMAAGLLDPLDGAITLDGRVLYMAQDVGTGEGTVRELLLTSAPARVADAGRAMLAAERDLDGRGRATPGCGSARRSATGRSSAATRSRACGTRRAGGSSARASPRSATATR